MKNKDIGYKIIITICISLIIAIIAIMIRGGINTTPDASRGFSEEQARRNQQSDNFFLKDWTHKKSSSIILTQEQLSELVKDKLPEDLPADTLALSLSEDGSIGITLTLGKQGLIDYLDGNDIKLPQILYSSLNFLNEPLTVSAVFTAETDEDSNLLMLNAVSLKINNAELDQPTILSVFSDVLTKSINKALCDSDIYFTDIEIKNNSVELKIK